MRDMSRLSAKARLRESLGEWIEENTHRANDTAISIAMLETAFDRYIDLLDATDAFECDRVGISARAEMFRRLSTVTVAEFVKPRAGGATSG